MIGQRRRAAGKSGFIQQWRNELVQVIDLLELATCVLVELAFARQDMQLLEQLYRLARAQLFDGLIWPGGLVFGWFADFLHVRQV